ncbi:MAG: glycosyltransferase family 4 protein [Candidatus Roizmanbacteria bacterium]|nr:glycosyltransferase family 4 protein [Candidatus Roizmanbacteria bacterium]
MKKLRIAMLFSSDPSAAGGVQEHIYHLSNELRKRGHIVDIFGPKPKPSQLDSYTSIGMSVEVPIINGNIANILLLDPKIDIDKILIDNKYDIIHAHEPYVPFAFWSIVNKLKTPCVTTFHTAWDDSSIINFINGVIPFFRDAFSKYVGGAIFVSKITQTRWKSLCDSSVKQRVLYNSVDTNTFIPKNKRTDALIQLLFVARLVHRKGLFQLLEAVKMLKEEGVKFSLTIIGDGKEKNKMLDYIKSYKLSTHIQYLGEIKGKKRAQYYKRADIFCAPYRDEAGSITILEAISAGLPIVGFSNELFKEALKDYPNKKLLVKQNNVQQLAKAIEFLIKNENEIDRIKEWCLEKKKEFSWETIAQKTESLYYELVESYERNNI